MEINFLSFSRIESFLIFKFKVGGYFFMEKGYFGEYGGSFVPPQLENALNQLDDALA